MHLCWELSVARVLAEAHHQNKASFKKGPKVMKTNAERISNRNTDRHFGAPVALSNRRMSGETGLRPRPRNNSVVPGFVVGALELLGYTSSPVLGSLLPVALSLAGSKGGPGFYIHRTDFLALINARSHGAYCTTTRWRSNHATQKIHPCLKRARSPHRARRLPRHQVRHHLSHHARHRTQNHAPHHMCTTRTSRWWAGPLQDC
jgi:hypothetical protein